jgi:hypothetical protein
MLNHPVDRSPQPPATTQAELAAKIAELVEAKTIEGVADVRDESDRTGEIWKRSCEISADLTDLACETCLGIDHVMGAVAAGYRTRRVLFERQGRRCATWGFVASATTPRFALIWGLVCCAAHMPTAPLGRGNRSVYRAADTVSIGEL